MTPKKLGYKEYAFGRYYKKYAGYSVDITRTELDGEWFGYIEISCILFYIKTQKQIDKLQIAFNNLQRDLKELNNENKNI